MITVLVVDDQALRRAGHRLLLDAQHDVTVVGEAATRREAARLLARLRPDVVVLSAHQPFADSIGILTRPERARPTDPPRPRVLLLAATDDHDQACSALRAGADGFLLHDALPDELAAAVRALAAGHAVLPPRLTHTLIDTVRRHRPPDPVGDGGKAALTAREREVLAALATGGSNAEIGALLCIAPTTVKSHVSSILTKIGARDRVQAVVFAYETGLVRPTPVDPRHP
ncbi:response regulator transcription factor [Streptomyces sp. RG80]|uniref:response regulator transcription factor n=1 Tax=Streptomyces sp. RG80 TaxID=3157340 RepID=UPI00338F9E6F